MKLSKDFLYTSRRTLLEVPPAGAREHLRMPNPENQKTPMDKFVFVPHRTRRRLPALKVQSLSDCAHSAAPFILALALLFTGCAHISFHDSNNPGRNIGFEYYKPKFYLLVTDDKDGTKASVVTLPDLTQPRYALLHAGYGSSNLSLAQSNGVLTTVGQAVDTKIPETIAAVSGLATAAAKRATRDADTGKPYAKLYELSNSDGRIYLKEVKFEPPI